MGNNKQIYLLCGKARTGKDTVADIILNYYKEKNIPASKLKIIEPVITYLIENNLWNKDEETKPRTLMQELGQQFRQDYGEDYFSNELVKKIKKTNSEIIVITDIRLPIEIEILKSSLDNVYAIEIIRNKETELTKTQKTHITEIALDNYDKYDYQINNNTSLEELKNKIINILEMEK